jgi:hypothetical protein
LLGMRLVKKTVNQDDVSSIPLHPSAAVAQRIDQHGKGRRDLPSARVIQVIP